MSLTKKIGMIKEQELDGETKMYEEYWYGTPRIIVSKTRLSSLEESFRNWF
jgi:hypothetical protein